MRELKAYRPRELVMQGRHNELIYLKSEADKVIADLEESHKKEVEQLLMEIVGLKKLVETADKLDGELKELMNGIGESKDSGGDGEA